jgi:hypothetical protein
LTVIKVSPKVLNADTGEPWIPSPQMRHQAKSRSLYIEARREVKKYEVPEKMPFPPVLPFITQQPNE